jgi:hypothetical protein
MKRMARTQDRPARRGERTILDDLSDAAATADRMLPQLRHLLGEPQGSGPSTGTAHRAPESSEPWNQAAAAVYWDIWYGARTLAQEMRRHLRLSDECPAGPDGLAQILACAPSVPDDMVKHAASRIWSWVQRANALDDVGESEPWVHVPHVAGAEPPACPYCKTFGLRMQRMAGQVRCFYPDCRDMDGNPTRAHMRGGQLGEAALVFGDGTTLAFTASADGPVP